MKSLALFVALQMFSMTEKMILVELTTIAQSVVTISQRKISND